MRRLSSLLLLLALALPGAAFASTDGSATDDASDNPVDETLVQSEAADEAATTVAETLEEEEPAREPFELPVDLSASVGTSFSLGSISRSNFVTRDSISTSWSFGVSRELIEDRLSASLGAGFSWCMNKNCGIVEPGEVRFRDMSLSFSIPKFYEIPRAGIGLSSGVSFTIPTSRISRTQNLYTTISPSLSMSRGFGPFSLSYSFGFSKNFNRYRVVVQDAEGNFEREVIIRENGAESFGNNFVEPSGYLGEWSTSHSLSAGLSLDNVRLSLGWSFADAWTYRTDLDAPDSLDNVDVLDPNPENERRGHSQFMTGSIGLSYTLPVWENRMSLSGRMSTSAPPKTADNRRIRFPWFDTQSANLQYTSLAFSLSVRY